MTSTAAGSGAGPRSGELTRGLILLLAVTSGLGVANRVILLDLGVQGTQISNQARIYALEPAARSRINTVFMVSTFAGGSIGSTAVSYAWHAWGWIGVCGTGGGLVLIAFLIWSSHLMSERS